jgi:predicted ATPase/DNA-binding CsgD family transcriptional regulator
MASHNPRHIPKPLSTFIGREREIAEVSQLLSANRLVTLTGPGGCGKTRLAIKVANEIVDDFNDGGWMIELAPLTSDSLVLQTVASIFNIHERQKQTLLERLVNFLRPRRAFLVFDNCEHLIGTCAELAELLLQACPDLSILATSREPLNVAGELVWAIPPLSLPEKLPWNNPRSAENILQTYEQSESFQLFVVRACSNLPHFDVTLETGGRVAEICRRLDGIPLAIELAAARVRTLSVAQIAERLDDRFNLLTSGNRTAPLRHQTLSATLDWSYALLSDVERRVLQRLSIFAGDASLEAAEYVCRNDEDDVLDTLSHLVDKSLVTPDSSQGTETRYRLLETIRQYAREKLIQAKDLEQSKNRHLDYFIEWAEKAELYLDTADQVAWLDRYETEHDNLRAALDFSISTSPEKNLRLAAACGRFWRLHGYLNEGRTRFKDVLSRMSLPGKSMSHARALTYSANLAYLQSDYAAMRPLGETALSIWRELGGAGRAGAAYTLDLLGELATEEGDYTSAPALFQEALEIYEDLHDVRGIGQIHMQFGWAAMRTGDYQSVKGHLEEFLSSAKQTGDKTSLAFAYSGLGEVAVRQGEHEHATSLLEKSLTLNHERGDKWGIGTNLGSLGWVALRLNDYRKMRSFLSESLSIRMEIGDKGGTAWCLEKLAEADFLNGQLQESANIFGCAAALRSQIGSVIDPADQPEYQRIITGLKTALGEKTFDSAWAYGTAMPLEAVINLALSEPEIPIEEPSLTDKEKFGGLTAREREVAVWIAQGKSNREIADSMTVGIKTIETYVTRILKKLGFDSRVQIAIWAKDEGLVASIKN